MVGTDPIMLLAAKRAALAFVAEVELELRSAIERLLRRETNGQLLDVEQGRMRSEHDGVPQDVRDRDQVDIPARRPSSREKSGLPWYGDMLTCMRTPL